jgi:hypothetical protein
VEVSKAAVVLEEEIVVGMVGRMDMAPPQMLQLVQEVAVVGWVADTPEEDTALAPQIEMALRVVGMIRVVADAHMMTETAVIVAAIVDMEIVIQHPVVVVVATWSR